jgi:hypothetical protein
MAERPQAARVSGRPMMVACLNIVDVAAGFIATFAVCLLLASAFALRDLRTQANRKRKR